MYHPQENRYQKLKYARCGTSGLKLPKVSLGLWHNFGDTGNFENMTRMVLTAFDQGITHFDLANNYGPAPGSAEIHFGRILREQLSSYRDELIISTKAGYDMWEGPYGIGGSRKYLLSSLDQSLKRMGVDYVDLFYHHCMDPETPLEETAGALEQAVQSGKALYVGLSNYDGPSLEKMSRLLKEARVPFIINQNRYNLLDRTIEKNGLMETGARLGIGLICFSPLAQGLLTDRYLKGIPEDSRIRTDGRFLKDRDITPELQKKLLELNEIAGGRGQSLASMSLSWLLQKEEVTSVLIGASRPAQILDSLSAASAAPFTKEELLDIEEILNA